MKKLAILCGLLFSLAVVAFTFGKVEPYALLVKGLKLEGFYSEKITSTATSYTVLTTDSHVVVTSTAAARTITIPAALIAENGWELEVSTSTVTTYPITIDPAGSVTVDGKSTYVIREPYGSVRLYSNGTNLFTRKQSEQAGFLRTHSTLTSASNTIDISTDALIFPVSKSGAVTVDLSADMMYPGRVIFVVDTSADTSADRITITTSNSAKIDTLDEYVMGTFYDAVGLVYDGAGWASFYSRKSPFLTNYYDGTDALDATADVALKSGGTITIDDDLLKLGRHYLIKDTSTDSVTIDPEGATTIDGVATAVIVNDYGSALVFSDGTSWWTKARDVSDDGIGGL